MAKNGRFQNLLAQLGGHIDRAVEGYEHLCEEEVVVRSGDEVVARISVPAKQAQKAIRDIKATVKKACDVTREKTDEVRAFVKGLSFTVVPKKAKK